MPTVMGIFENIHKNYFGAVDGAYTAMTAAEVGKRSFNVKAHIRSLAFKHNLGSAIDRSIKNCDFNISDKVFGFPSLYVNLRFRYSKPDSDEMSIYFNPSQGIPSSKLVSGNIWFIYFKENDPTPWLGIMTPAEWTVVTGTTTATAPVVTPKASIPTTTKRRISKKTLSHDDTLAEKELDLELIDDIQDSEIPETATFEYSGKPKAKQEPISAGTRKKYKRDKQTALNALVKAGHKCEVDSHPSFLRKHKNIPYMEPHHLIPLKYQDDFESSLDVEENIVSLCSNCHNRLHYGWGFSQILEKLYNERIEHLRRAGIDISFEELLEIYS